MRLYYTTFTDSELDDTKEEAAMTYCEVLGVCVTNNKGLWIWWLGLLALLYNYSQL
jgi:hypothetical protein